MVRSSQISGKELGRALTRLGFQFKSQKGSHMKFVRLHGGVKEVIIVPSHKVLRKGTLRGILKQLNLNIEKLEKLL